MIRAWLIAIVICASPLSSSWAQQADDEANASQPRSLDRSRVLEEIVVTARRREEQLQTVPVAVTPLTAAELHDASISEINEIDLLVPNLLIRTGGTGQADTSVVTIRGLQEASADLTIDPVVGLQDLVCRPPPTRATGSSPDRS